MVFTIGLQSPGFFDSFKKNGRNLLMMALMMLVGAGSNRRLTDKLVKEPLEFAAIAA